MRIAHSILSSVNSQVYTCIATLDYLKHNEILERLTFFSRHCPSERMLTGELGTRYKCSDNVTML